MNQAALTPADAAVQILTLINASPRTPSAREITSIIARATVVAPASPLTQKLRRLRPVLDAAVAEECDTENTPAYAAAFTKARSLDQEFESLCRQAWERPVANCDRDDLAMRCEAALAYWARGADGSLWGLNTGDGVRRTDCPSERSIAHLLIAVAAFTGCQEAHHG